MENLFSFFDINLIIQSQIQRQGEIESTMHFGSGGGGGCQQCRETDGFLKGFRYVLLGYLFYIVHHVCLWLHFEAKIERREIARNISKRMFAYGNQILRSISERLMSRLRMQTIKGKIVQ